MTLLEKMKDNTEFKIISSCPTKDYYKLKITGDENDGDFVYSEFAVEDIFEDELLALILCYVTTQPYDFDKSWPDVEGAYNVLGFNFAEDKFFPWLSSYFRVLEKLKRYEFAPPFAHTIFTIDIFHISKTGEIKSVSLPNIIELFDNADEMSAYINKLFEEFKNKQFDAFAEDKKQMRDHWEEVFGD